MSSEIFRALTLSLPGAVEGAHMGHADFRVAKKIFASLDAEETRGTVKLEPPHQQRLVRGRPGAWKPHNGSWGQQGWTHVDLDDAPEDELREAVEASFRLIAPKKLAAKLAETPVATLRAARADEIETVLAIDDDAYDVFTPRGLNVHLADDHPFRQGERRRWQADAAEGRLLFACMDGAPVGFADWHLVDGAPYLDQLSVRAAHIGRGVGRLLLARAIAWSVPRGDLWLTTYAHVPWNRAYYEQAGFEVVPEDRCGPEIRRILDSQRQALPAPEERVAMRRRARR